MSVPFLLRGCVVAESCFCPGTRGGTGMARGCRQGSDAAGSEMSLGFGVLPRPPTVSVTPEGMHGQEVPGPPWGRAVRAAAS